MNTLLTVLILVLVVYFLFWVIDAIPLPAPANVVAKVIVAILAVYELLAFLPHF